MGQELAADGAEVYALDLRGFENSKEEGLSRGDTRNFKRHLKDVNEVVDFVRKSHPGKGVYMFGHSIGGCYTLWYAANHPDSLDGIILAAPAIVLAPGISGRDYIRFLFLLLFAPKTTYEPYKTLPPDQR
jgi:alpha-beta hydrolase superfamily lysophospholipase